MARIKEIEESKDNPKDEGDVASLAAHTACLSDDQCKEWLTEMKGMGINFKWPAASGNAKGHIPPSCISSPRSLCQRPLQSLIHLANLKDRCPDRQWHN